MSNYIPSQDPYFTQPKPLIGIMPKYIWEEKRFRELSEAMIRYLQAKLEVPTEWIDEYNEFIERGFKNTQETSQNDFWELLDEEIDNSVSVGNSIIEMSCHLMDVKIDRGIKNIGQKLVENELMVDSFLWRFDMRVDRAISGERPYRRFYYKNEN